MAWHEIKSRLIIFVRTRIRIAIDLVAHAHAHAVLVVVVHLVVVGVVVHLVVVGVIVPQLAVLELNQKVEAGSADVVHQTVFFAISEAFWQDVMALRSVRLLNCHHSVSRVFMVGVVFFLDALVSV